MLIKELMTKEIKTIEPNSTLKKVWDIMSENQIRHLVVSDEGKVTGIISDRDLLKTYDRPTIQCASDIMSWPVMTVRENTLVENVVEEVLLQKVSAFLVDDDKGKTIGIVTTEDLLTYLYMLLRIEKKSALRLKLNNV